MELRDTTVRDFFWCDCERTRGRASVFAISMSHVIYSVNLWGGNMRGIGVKMTRTAGQNAQPRRGRP
jgi:hypothetical protein